MKKILITGASGFVGSHLLKALSNYSDIHIIASFRDKTKVPNWFNGEVKIGDLRDIEYIKNLLKEIDIVAHCASWASLWGYENESKELYLNPTIKLIKEAKEQNISKFINISTISASFMQNLHQPNREGEKKEFWPHLNSVIEIENELREVANEKFSVINLRLGLFIGENYSLGLLPILLPRLKTHLVPYINGGETNIHLIDGRDIARAFVLSILNENIKGYESFNIIGKDVPKMKEVIEFLNKEFKYPKPHFNISFNFAYKFAFLAEKVASFFHIEPFITRSIIHLLENREVNNLKAKNTLGFEPKENWRDSIKRQISQIKTKKSNMKMSKELPL